MSNNSLLISKTIALILPFLIMFGVYVVLNGHVSPGGGFQGGAILATIVIVKYFIDPEKETSIEALRIIEKIALIFIFAVATSFLLTVAHVNFQQFNVAYLILMNVLISIKVACGITIIFIRFEFYETR